MNNARIWLAVKPTIGVPLFFAGIAATSLIVHAAVLTHTTWYPAFYQGNQKARTSEASPATLDTKALAGVTMPGVNLALK
jgi:light-harvesting protein B-800-850 alpha chain